MSAQDIRKPQMKGEDDYMLKTTKATKEKTLKLEQSESQKTMYMNRASSTMRNHFYRKNSRNLNPFLMNSQNFDSIRQSMFSLRKFSPKIIGKGAKTGKSRQLGVGTKTTSSRPESSAATLRTGYTGTAKSPISIGAYNTNSALKGNSRNFTAMDKRRNTNTG